MPLIKRHTEEEYYFHDKNGLENGLYNYKWTKIVTFLGLFKSKRSYNRTAKFSDSVKKTAGFGN